MNEQIIEIESDSLDEARKTLSVDAFIIQEFILCSGKLETVEGIANTVDEAVTKAKNRIPAEAKIESREIKIAPKRVVLQVEGDNEESAGKGKAEVIESVSLHKKGRKGFLGFGKAPNVYEVVVSQQAVVEVKFREKARLLAIVKGYLAKDLLQGVEDLRRRNAPWEEVLQLLNPKKDDQIKKLLNGLLVPDLIDLHSALNIIESACLRNEAANWQRAIEEAHSEASRARKRLWTELRGLDAELADVFMFYTSIDWYAKGNREPTGIPRHTTDWDGNRPPDERFRKTIPRYSTDEKAFAELRRRAIEFGTYELSKQFLDEEGQDEATATLKQKCVALLKARQLELKGGR